MTRQGSLRFRDLHLFDETIASDYLTKKGTSTQCLYDTLPLVDGFRWSSLQTVAGLRFRSKGGLEIKGDTPVVHESGSGELTVRWPTHSPKGEMVMTFSETSISLSAEGGLTDNWYLELSSDEKAELPFKEIGSKRLSCEYRNTQYFVSATHGRFAKEAGSGLRLNPEHNRIVLDLSSR